MYSVYDDEFTTPLHKDFAKKVLHEGIEKGDLEHYKNPTFVNISKAAVDLSDGIIIGSAKINSDVSKYIKKSGKPVLEFIASENNEYIDAYSEFYDAVLEEVVEMAE